VVAGSTCRGTHCDFALARLKRNGELDASFGNDGRVVTRVDPGGAPRGISAMALDSRGRIIAAGDVSRERVALVRYKKDGRRDRSFGHGGIAVKQHLDQLGGIAAIAITPEDKIVAAGPRKSALGKRKWVLARFGRSGGLNSSFGDGGEVTTDPGSGNAEVRAVAIDSKNRIVATGKPEFSLARLQPNGNFSRSFGHRGTVTKDLGGAEARSVAIDSRNRPVVAGDGGTKFVVARLVG
jgi:uncharacterized delta-60 repeat protein